MAEARPAPLWASADARSESVFAWSRYRSAIRCSKVPEMLRTACEFEKLLHRQIRKPERRREIPLAADNASTRTTAVCGPFLESVPWMTLCCSPKCQNSDGAQEEGPSLSQSLRPQRFGTYCDGVRMWPCTITWTWKFSRIACGTETRRTKSSSRPLPASSSRQPVRCAKHANPERRRPHKHRTASILSQAPWPHGCRKPSQTDGHLSA